MVQLVNGQFAFESNRTIIAYYIRGQGPPCFVAPYPWGLNSEPIRSFFRPLERHLTLVYHDPPGSGRSGPPMQESDLGFERVVSDMFSIQTRLDVREATFIGHSGGAACALAYALRYPERVSSLVLIGAGAVIPDVLRSKEVGESMAGALSQRNEESFRRFLAAFLGPEIRSSKGRLAMGRAMKSSLHFNIDRAAHNFAEMRDWDVRGDLGKVVAKTLILAGKHDGPTPPKLARELHKAIKGSRLVIFEKSGHFPFLDEPTKFSDALLGFLGVRRQTR